MKQIVSRIILINALLTFQSIFTQNIQWQSGNWAFACDFVGGDLSNVRMLNSGAQCGPTCAATNGCTHFTWTTYLGGTCWMKSGSVSQFDAFYTGDSSMVCGITSGKAY